MLLWVGRFLIAAMTFTRSTPLRSENRLHSFTKARIVARYEFSTILVVSDSIGRSITVSSYCSVLRTSRRNRSTRIRAASSQPLQTRQKSRMLDTYCRPGITRSKLCASSGVAGEAPGGERLLEDGPRDELGRPRGDGRLDEDQAVRSRMRSPIVRSVASRAAMSVSPVRMLPRSCLA